MPRDPSFWVQQVIVQKAVVGGSHLAMFCGIVFISDVGTSTAMLSNLADTFLKIKNGK
jgi:hypothetical protein